MNDRRFYLILTAVLLFAAAVCTLLNRGKATAEKGYTEPVIPSGWQKMIADDVSGTEPVLVVDGMPVPKGGASPYVTGDLDVMLPVEMVRQGLSCAAVRSDASHVFLCRGERKVFINTESDEVTVDGNTDIVAGAVLLKNGQLYLSAEMLADIFELDMRFDARKNELRMNFLHPEESFLPSMFTYEEINRVPKTLDQGKEGTCWAFSVLTALESTLLPEERMIFSREHMVKSPIYGEGAVESGNERMAAAYLLSWSGPVSDTENGGLPENAENIPPVRHVQGMRFMEHPDPEEIKKAVFLNGGVSTNMYLAMADKDNLLYVDHYYNKDYYCYYYNGDKEVNHEVVVIGWDDRYDKNRFVLGKKLPGNGAFLCMNSWGEGFGNSGLFWVSYYDRSFAQSAVCFTQVESNVNFDRIYQTDLAGATANAGYDTDTAWFSNVYTAGQEEYLRAAGFYTLGDDTEYEIRIVHDFTDESSLKDGILLTSGVIRESGFHTVRIPDAVFLDAGEKFAVVVKVRTPECSFPVAIEKVTDTVPDADVTDGEGYLSNNGLYYKNTETDSACNVCLKVYTELKREHNR